MSEYEIGGEDRSKYGRKLIPTISELLRSKGLKGMGTSNLWSFISPFRKGRIIRKWKILDEIFTFSKLGDAGVSVS